MDDSATARRPVGQMALLLILLGLGLRFIQIGLGDPPPAEAAGRPAQRVEWLDDCGLPGAVGLYAAGDPACRPGRVVPLSWLQGQAADLGLLTGGEYLRPARHPSNAACRAEVLALSGAPAGWLCADAPGLYRTDDAGRDPGTRWPAGEAGAFTRAH